MKKIISFVLMMALLVSCQGGPKEEVGKKERPVVYTSFYPLKYMVETIAEDRVEVRSFVPENQEVHDWEPSAKEIAGLDQVDLFLVNGLGLEPWLEKIEETQDLLVVDTSEKVDFIMNDDHDHEDDHDYDHEDDHDPDHEDDHDHDHEDDHDHDHEDDHDHDHDHDHGPYNPHIWLAPRTAMVQAEAVKEALVELLPAEKDFFEKNYDYLKEELEAMDQEYEEKLTSETYIIVPHKAFDYLERDYKIIQLPMAGVFAEGESDLKRMGELVDFGKEHGIKTVFYEKGGSPKNAEALAKEIGAQAKALSTIEGLDAESVEEGLDYIDLMRFNMESIIENRD